MAPGAPGILISSDPAHASSAPSEAVDTSAIPAIPLPWAGAPIPTRLPPSSFTVTVPASTVVPASKPFAVRSEMMEPFLSLSASP